MRPGTERGFLPSSSWWALRRLFCGTGADWVNQTLPGNLVLVPLLLPLTHSLMLFPAACRQQAGKPH